MCTVKIVIPLKLSLTFKALSRSHEPSQSLATLTYPMQLYRRVNEARSQLRYIAEILHLPNLVTFALACKNDMDCKYTTGYSKACTTIEQQDRTAHDRATTAPKCYIIHNALHVTDNMVRRLGIQKYQSAIDMFYLVTYQVIIRCEAATRNGVWMCCLARHFSTGTKIMPDTQT